jgi:peptide/nickel transport system permease protein
VSRTLLSVLGTVLRRLLVVAVQLLLISFGVFLLLALSPGKTETLLAGPEPSREQLEAIRQRYHLDDPFIVQYGKWLGDAVQLDLGESLQTREPVSSVLRESAPITGQLALLSLAMTVVVAIPAGLFAASRRGRWSDSVVSVVSMVGSTAPTFAVGLLLMVVVGLNLGWLPVFGEGDGFGDRVRHLVLPAISLAIALCAFLVRQTRAAALTVVAQDYMTFARARGLPRRRVWGAYLLRNAALPTLTATGVLLAYLVSGAVLVEVLYSLPGLGRVLLTAVASKDVPVIQGVALVTMTVVLFVNGLVEVLYNVLDPRLRHGSP